VPYGAGDSSGNCCSHDYGGGDIRYLSNCTERVMGWDAYYCPPPKTWNGWANEYYDPSGRPIWSPEDLTHGNGVVAKTRQEYAYPPGSWNLTWTNVSLGNSFESIHYCEQVTNPTPPPATDFSTIREVHFEGVAPDWLGVCVIDSDCSELPTYPPIPGLGDWDADQTSPLCDYTEYEDSTPCSDCIPPAPGECQYHWDCAVGLGDFDICGNCWVWAKVDVHLQNGVPMLEPYILTMRKMSDADPQTPIGYPVSECPELYSA
jgi:hypothetical protein